MRKQAWLAIIICILGLVPGLLFGAVAAYLYRLSTAWHVGYNPDFMMLRTIFGIEWPGMILQWILFQGIPSGVHGFVAGAMAVFITSTICKGAPIDLAAYATGTLVTGVFLVFLFLGWMSHATIMDVTLAEAVLQIVGLWCGLIGTASSVRSDQSLSQT
jgi:hypothetical protein